MAARRAVKRVCRGCKADLSAKPKPGSRALRLPEFTEIVVVHHTPGADFTCRIAFCPTCVANRHPQVFADAITELF